MVEYVNTSNRAITVFISVTSNATSVCELQITGSDGANFFVVQKNNNTGGGNGYASGTIVVPPGKMYKATGGAASSLTRWIELS